MSTSDFVKRQSFTSTSLFVASAEWESIAPFGRPVVPDVYNIAARSLGDRATGFWARSGRFIASISWRKVSRSQIWAASLLLLKASKRLRSQMNSAGLESNRKYSTSSDV